MTSTSSWKETGSNSLEKICERYEARKRSHERFGTARVIFPDGFRIDVATARLEYYEKPASLPNVEWSSLKLDLYRRDFTMNTLAVRLDPVAFRGAGGLLRRGKGHQGQGDPRHPEPEFHRRPHEDLSGPALFRTVRFLPRPPDPHADAERDSDGVARTAQREKAPRRTQADPPGRPVQGDPGEDAGTRPAAGHPSGSRPQQAGPHDPGECPAGVVLVPVPLPGHPMGGVAVQPPLPARPPGRSRPWRRSGSGSPSWARR